MHTNDRPLLLSALSLALALASSACSGDDTSDTSATGTTTSATATTSGTSSGTSAATESTGPGTSTDATSTSSGSTTGNVDDPFVFDDSDPGSLAQVDRMGMPAINTVAITSKDDYNQASPADDAGGTFVPEITTNLTALHAALDDDFAGLKLVPCTIDTCLGQAGPLVVPDTLKINTGAAAGFPNGRKLADPVIDVTLAVVFLDLSVMGQTATTLAEVPVNPPKNDKDFLPDFPYLADPH